MYTLKTLNRAVCWRMALLVRELFRIGWVGMSSLRRWHLNWEQLMRRTEPCEDLLKSIFLASGYWEPKLTQRWPGPVIPDCSLPCSLGLFVQPHCPNTLLRLGLSKASHSGFWLVTHSPHMHLFLVSSAEFSTMSVNGVLRPDLRWRRKTERKKNHKGW